MNNHNNNNSWILSFKVLLISAAVFSLAVVLRFSVPIIADGIPATWSFILSWLKPPYLYLIINAIIITIAAVHHVQSVETPPESLQSSFSAHPDIISSSSSSSVVAEEPILASAEVAVSEIEDPILELTTTADDQKVDIDIDSEEEAVVEEAEDGDVFVDWTLKPTNSPPPPPEEEDVISQLESRFPVREKPLVMSRFGHRKPNRTTPEGVRGLRVSRAKKHDTLESTWKMITEGRHVPLNRHLKKTEEESEGRIGKEGSLGQDELNRRVEAFIKKFNEEMRIQRQESLNQFMEMINRGV